MTGDMVWIIELVRMALERLNSGEKEVVLRFARRGLEVSAWLTLDGIMLELKNLPVEEQNAKA